jgi:pilus assembly protein CpaB
VSPRRTVIIIVAILIAAVAAVANVLYLNGVQDRANGHAKLLKVFVVAQDIPKGTTGETAISQGLVKSGSIPERFRPATALSDINNVRGKVALTALAAGQVVVDGQFVEPKAAEVTFSQRIPAGQVAISVSFGSVQAVGNLLVPGDKVDMIVTPQAQTTATGSSDTSTAAAKTIGANNGNLSLNAGTAVFLYQNVNILAIGSATAPQAGETQSVTNPGGGLITFALPPAAAQRIILASTGGSIYLALVPPDNQPTPIPNITPENFFNGITLTPYG